MWLCLRCESPALINSRLNVVVWSPTPFGLSQNGCWPSWESQLPWALPFIFSTYCPLNDRKKAAHSFFKITRLSSLFSCLSLAHLHHLILLLLLMSGNLHPNRGHIFPCSVCAENATWRGKPVQCSTCSKWVHLRCSLSPLKNLELLAALIPGAGPLAASLFVTLWFPSRTPPAGIPPLYNLAPFNNAALPPTLVFKPVIPSLPILYLLPVPPHHLDVLLCLLLSPLTRSRFFNGMLVGFEPGALNCFTFFCPIPLTLSVPRNPILTHFPFSRFLDSLLCVLIAPTLGPAFSLMMPRTLVAVSSFLSDRAYLSLHFLPPLSLCLTPTLIM